MRALRYQVLQRLPDECSINKGHNSFSPRVEQLLYNAQAIIETIAAQKSALQLPETKPERSALSRLIINTILDNSSIHVITPACPDYGSGSRFYQSIGSGVSPEACGAIRAGSILTQVFNEFDINHSIKITIANTEDDVSDIINRCAQGSTEMYHSAVSETVESIQQQVKSHSTIHVGTFTDLFPLFRERQYSYEHLIRTSALEDKEFSLEIHTTSNTRAERHAQILGRPEKDLELTVRYMAQYAALGSIARENPNPVLFVNYQTPNRRHYNIGYYKNIALSEQDNEIIPVVGSVVKRNV